MREALVTTLVYADDGALFGEGLTEVQALLDVLLPCYLPGLV
jgi:hypothetical protein